MTWLRQLLANYRYYKRIKELNISTVNGQLPSSVYMKYPSDHTFNGKKVLNFGCGRATFKAPNVLNVDTTSSEGVVVLEKGQRLSQFGKDFDFIIANHVMEHLPDWFSIMKEFAEILKPGGRIEIWVPPVSNDTAFSYRDHLNRIGVDSFSGCASSPRPGTNLLASKEFEELGEFRKLYMVERKNRPIVTWWTLVAPQPILKWMTTHLRNVLSEEAFIFTKLP